MARVNPSLALFPAEALQPAPPPAGEPPASAPEKRPRLWLCLLLPLLPLEVFAAPPARASFVVVEGEGSRREVLTCNRVAARNGIRPGIGLDAAYALVPDLLVRQRSRRRERQALTSLAAWAGQFTPAVSLVGDEALLLEVQGSLRLFGGVDALRERLCDGVAVLGHRPRTALAPTPLASLWLARAGRGSVARELHDLPGQLASVPLTAAAWPPRTRALLAGMGVRTLGECLRLPRDGLARRIGRERLDELDRALGRRPDPRPFFEPPTRFVAELELAAELIDSEQLLPALERLVARLDAFLRARQGGVQCLQLEFFHLDQPATPLRVGLLEGTRDAQRLLSLIGLQLEQLTLPAPVIALRLRTDRVRTLQPRSGRLLGRGATVAQPWPELVERLRARLGVGSLHGMSLVPEHRPERAWRAVSPVDAEIDATGAQRAERPLWLLPEPRRLPSVDGRPCCDGPLAPERGPERIESGWWDDADVARDYYVAADARGLRLWIFRERREPRDWYLHGIFG